MAGAGSFETTAASVDWTHDFSSLTRLEAGLEVSSDEYNGISRADDRFEGYVGLSRAIQRWLTVGVRYEHGARDSSAANNDYRYNQFTVGVRSTFY